MPSPGKMICVPLDPSDESDEPSGNQIHSHSHSHGHGDSHSHSHDDSSVDGESERAARSGTANANVNVDVNVEVMVMVIGYITSGSFSPSRGGGFGVGLCTVPGLQTALARHHHRQLAHDDDGGGGGADDEGGAPFRLLSTRGVDVLLVSETGCVEAPKSTREAEGEGEGAAAKRGSSGGAAAPQVALVHAQQTQIARACLSLAF